MIDEDTVRKDGPAKLARADGATIAYHRSPGKSPGVVFLGGFKSDMTGTKALALEAWLRARGQAYVRFDYQGHGASSGQFADGTIGGWTDDAIAVIDACTEGPQVLVGSSMGGWIMLLAALARPDRVRALLGIAAAPDFTEDLILPELNHAQQTSLAEQGFCLLANGYDDAEPYRIEATFLEEARDHLMLRDEIPLNQPLRLIHGIRDTDVPWRTSLAIMDGWKGSDVEVQFLKGGDHRLSEPGQLARLYATLEELL